MIKWIKLRLEPRHFICKVALDADRLADEYYGHRYIKNKSHWVPEASCYEINCMIYYHKSYLNLPTIRHNT